MKDKSIWRYLTIGGTLGLLIGFLINVLGAEILSYPSKPIYFLMNLINDCLNISCAFYFLFSTLIAYIIIGIVAGYVIYKLKMKNEK